MEDNHADGDVGAQDMDKQYDGSGAHEVVAVLAVGGDDRFDDGRSCHFSSRVLLIGGVL